MSQPDKKVELHSLVEEYCDNFIGEPIEKYYLHEEIDCLAMRTDRYYQFMEYVNEL